VTPGQSASFSVTATAPGLTYQWLKNGTAIPGATNSTFTIPSPQASDVGVYTVRLTSGTNTQTASAELTVGGSGAIAITSQPSGVSVAPGQTAVFTVEAFGTGITYQWLKNDVAIAGATSSSYTIASPQSGDAGSYTVRVTGASGSVVSAPAVLTVAQEHARKAGVDARFSLLEGDALRVDLGSGYDVVLLTNFLHHFDAATCEALLRRIARSLTPSGVVITLEFVPSEDRVTPAPTARFAAVMLATTAAGDAYTFAEYQAMFRNAGFSHNELHPLPDSPQSGIRSTL
jgi:SAM-dependent methyltransferase